jgi:hypothetical protein
VQASSTKPLQLVAWAAAAATTLRLQRVPVVVKGTADGRRSPSFSSSSPPPLSLSSVASFEFDAAASQRRDPPQFAFAVNNGVADDAVVDAPFARLAATYGTVRCFHGSPLQRWHSIISNGLQVKSGTSEADNGALFGNGIYFSDALDVARGFAAAECALWSSSRRFGGGARVECVGVFAVANDPQHVHRRQALTEKASAAATAAAAAAAAASSSAGKVRKRASPSLRGSGGGVGGAVPDRYVVVTDAQCVKLTHLLIWVTPARRTSTAAFYAMVCVCVVVAVAAYFAQLSPRQRNLLIATWMPR